MKKSQFFTTALIYTLVILSYPWLILTGLVSWLFMHRLNDTTVIGRKNLPRQRNVLVVSNHLTLIDSWFIEVACFWPQAVLKPWLLPWHLPETKNYFKNWLLASACVFWKCIPIKRGTGNFVRKLPFITEALRSGSLLIFPEGTRSRKPKSGILYQWNHGAARLAYQSQATVVPVSIRGIEEVLPIGGRWVKWNHNVVIVIGRPIHGLATLYRQPRDEALPLLSDVIQARLQRTLKIASDIYERKERLLTEE